MSTYTLLDLDTVARQVGRMSVFYAASYWSPGSALALTHLGDTEGEVGKEENEEQNILRTPEVSGPMKIDVWHRGEDPVITIPIYFAQTALNDVLSPVGTGSAGYERARPVVYRTLVLLPEQLFFNPTTYAYQSLASTAGVWTLGGGALTTDQVRLLNQSYWFWKGYFGRPSVTWTDEDGRKALGTVDFNPVRHGGMPNGHQLYTKGSPVDAGIDID